jgi:hypothetical protein
MDGTKPTATKKQTQKTKKLQQLDMSKGMLELVLKCREVTLVYARAACKLNFYRLRIRM